MPVFKEFAGQNRVFNQPKWGGFSSKFKPHAQRHNYAQAVPSEGIGRSLFGRGDSRSFFRNINSFDSSPSNRFHGFRGEFPKAYQMKSRHEDAAVSEKTRLDSRLISSNQQSTELTIRTRDGDLVTIRLNEKEYAMESLKYRSIDEDTGNEGHVTEIDEFHKKDSAEAFNLQALFEDGEVSNVSMELDSRSREFTEVNYTSVDEDSRTTAKYRSMNASSSHLSFEVEGKLDKNELAAIGALLEDVTALATEFFDGDVQAAFSQATQLGYDDSEIAGYALSLTENETSVAANRYHKVIGAESSFPFSVARPIGTYVMQLESIQQTANLYFESQSLNVMMDRIARVHNSGENSEVEASERFRDFNEKLLESIKQSRFTR